MTGGRYAGDAPRRTLRRRFPAARSHYARHAACNPDIGVAVQQALRRRHGLVGNGDDA
jgi:hypothetical protein